MGPKKPSFKELDTEQDGDVIEVAYKKREIGKCYIGQRVKACPKSERELVTNSIESYDLLRKEADLDILITITTNTLKQEDTSQSSKLQFFSAIMEYSSIDLSTVENCIDT